MAALGGAEAGLVTCDGAGALMLRKPVEDLPRRASAPAAPCGRSTGRWPVRPSRSRRWSRCPADPAAVPRPGRRPAAARDRLRHPAVLEATMLVEPVEEAATPPLKLGTACRVCPRDGCLARREPSILGADAG
ncbi:MAG: hypothetical protein R3D59_11375 [Paracoccaceae bacterium]